MLFGHLLTDAEDPEMDAGEIMIKANPGLFYITRARHLERHH